MIDNMTLLWFSLIFFFLFLEMGHPGLLYFISFSCGALCSFLATFYGASIPFQLSIFLAGTCGALLMVYMWVGQKKNQLQASSHRSNLEAFIGQKVIVVQALHDEKIWQTHIFGQVWQVRSIHGQPLHQGQVVTVIDVQGCHLRVDTLKA